MATISVTAFKNKYSGLPVDYDNYPLNNPFQCYDIFAKAWKQVYGISAGVPVLPTGGARDLYERFYALNLDRYFNRLQNLPGRKPKRGDTVIWKGTSANPYGHVDLYLRWNFPGKFKGFDQNWPVGSKAHVQLHTKSGVYGWLRPKTPVKP